jgi:hypothetical protein
MGDVAGERRPGEAGGLRQARENRTVLVRMRSKASRTGCASQAIASARGRRDRTRSIVTSCLQSRSRQAREGPQLVVMAPSLVLEISVERSPADETEIHIHAGGQGFWVARLAHALGAQVRLCTTLGGESGVVLRGLVERTGFALEAVRSGHVTATYIEDRRGEEPIDLAVTQVPPLGRHEIDELYGMTLAGGLNSDGVLITGPRTEDQLDRDFYRRLVGDLHQRRVRCRRPLRRGVEGGGRTRTGLPQGER